MSSRNAQMDLIVAKARLAWLSSLPNSRKLHRETGGAKIIILLLINKTKHIF